MMLVFRERSGTGKEAILSYFEMLFQICLKELRKAANSLSLCSAGMHKSQSYTEPDESIP
jgi:hypothetical protein